MKAIQRMRRPQIPPIATAVGRSEAPIPRMALESTPINPQRK